MRIGIDARELAGHPTGVGRYLAGLLNAWSIDRRAPHHEFVLYSSEPLATSLDAHRFANRLVAGAPDTRWEQFRLPAVMATDHLDAMFSPGYTTPLFRATPAVVAIHDVSFAAHPEWFSGREGLRRRWLTRRSAHHARAVVTISEFSKREIGDRFNVAAARIHVIPPGVTSPAGSEARPGPRAPQLLYVGSIFNRRHVPDLVRAFADVARAHPDATLDIVGDNRSHPRQDVAAAIAAHGLNNRARWREYVPDHELSRLYANARAFAFLSEYEGLGLTPLEALAAGAPSVLLDTPVARESCGAAALYVAPGDTAAVARAITSLLFDDAVRDRLLAAAPAVLARYDWRRAAQETLAVIEGCGPPT